MHNGSSATLLLLSSVQCQSRFSFWFIAPHWHPSHLLPCGERLLSKQTKVDRLTRFERGFDTLRAADLKVPRSTMA